MKWRCSNRTFKRLLMNVNRQGQRGASASRFSLEWYRGWGGLPQLLAFLNYERLWRRAGSTWCSAASREAQKGGCDCIRTTMVSGRSHTQSHAWTLMLLDTFWLSAYCCVGHSLRPLKDIEKIRKQCFVGRQKTQARSICVQWTSPRRGQKTQFPFTARFVLGENDYLFSILLGSFNRKIRAFSIRPKCFDFLVKAAGCQLAKYFHFWQVFFPPGERNACWFSGI